MKSTKAISTLEEKLNVEILLPTDDSYDEARSIYNAMIDKRPAFIAKCKSAEDVIEAVRYARDENIEVSICSGEAPYGDNYGRLQKVKAKYDPDNFFHINQNIKPE